MFLTPSQTRKALWCLPLSQCVCFLLLERRWHCSRTTWSETLSIHAAALWRHTHTSMWCDVPLRLILIGWDVESQARVEKPSRARFTSNSWNSFFFRQAVKLLNSIGYNILFVSWHESRWKETLSLPTRIIDPLQQAVYCEASWKRLNSLAESGQVLVLCTRCSDQSLMQAFNLVANLPFWLFKPENVDLLLTIYRPL